MRWFTDWVAAAEGGEGGVPMLSLCLCQFYFNNTPLPTSEALVGVTDTIVLSRCRPRGPGRRRVACCAAAQPAPARHAHCAAERGPWSNHCL